MLFELILLTISLIIVYWYYAKPDSLPPGPCGIPILGYTPWFIYYSNDRTSHFEELHKKYGPIVCARVGFSYIIILNDTETIKDAFAKHGEYFSGRGLELLRKFITDGKGILTTEGSYQREHRRFILRTLRNMGFGKISFEGHVMDSIRTMQGEVDKHIQQHPDDDMDIRTCLTEAVVDNITRIVLGAKFNKEELQFIISRLEAASNIPPVVFIVNAFPILFPFFNFKFLRRAVGIETFKEIRKPLEARIMKYVKQHKEKFDRENIEDFVDAYIDEQPNHTKTPKERNAWDDTQIMHAATELVAAGTGTTESTIMWIFSLVASNPDWQVQVQEEIDQQIGREKSPSMTNLPLVPKCEATVLEALRWSILALSGIPHSVTETCTFRGYNIPKGSTVFSFLYATTREPSVWKDPDNFNPAANFLDSDGKTVINRDQIIPFSVGRRSCIGESLARMEVTLFFMAFMQRYTIMVSKEHGPAQVKQGLFRGPSHRYLRFSIRP